MKINLNKNIDKIQINGIGIIVCLLIYIYLPIIIFILSWIKPIYSIPTTLIIIYFLYKYYLYKKNKLQDIEPKYINITFFIFLCIIIFIIGTLLGWTNIFNQPYDWIKHNGILLDLTNKSWPVYYTNNEETSMLTYYLGQYIFPTLIGKIFSSVYISQIFNGYWAMIGLLIAILKIFSITNSDSTKKQIITTIVIFLFSVCTIISQFLGKIFIPEANIDNGHWFMFTSKYLLQYSSNIVLLRWVMPQCIIPWIILSILYEDKFDIKHYVILCLPIFFYSTLSFIGIIIYLFVFSIIYLCKIKKIKIFIKEIFSKSNIFISLSLGLLLILYFSGNILSEKTSTISLNIVTYPGKNILLYLFFICSFLPYSILLFKENRKNFFFWISTILLLILPFFKMGLFNDLCMRVSIIPLYIYMVSCIKLLNTNNLYKKIFLIMFLFIGFYSSFKELGDIESTNNIPLISLETNANRHLNILDDLKYNYYTYDLETNFFYKHIAKNKLSVTD